MLSPSGDIKPISEYGAIAEVTFKIPVQYIISMKTISAENEVSGGAVIKGVRGILFIYRCRHISYKQRSI